jgi:biotin transporter BioY
MAALICIAGPLTIAIGPIPLSLASFAVYMAGAVLGSRRGTAAVALYLLIGIIGVPVFSGFTGGFQKLAGVTGGYLIGYLPCAFLTGIGTERKAGRRWLLPASRVPTPAMISTRQRSTSVWTHSPTRRCTSVITPSSRFVRKS